MEPIDLILNSNLKQDTSTTHLLKLESTALLPTIDDSISNQNTITKKQTQTNTNPFSSIFHPLHHHYHLHVGHHKSPNDANTLTDYSSESLLQCVKDGNLNFIREILEYHKTLSHSSSDGNFLSKPINNITNNNTITSTNASSAYKTLTSKFKTKLDLEIHDEVKQTPLIIATRNNSYEIAELLIKNGAKVNSKDMDSWSPLLNASKNGNLKLVNLLLENKAYLEDKDLGGFTPLMWACYKNHLDIVKLLLKYDANPNSQCKNLICCLSWAAGRGYLEIVNELLKRPNIKINSQDQNSSTPILWAARKGSLPIVVALIEKGANPDLVGMNNLTPLIISCKNGHIDVALYLSKLNNINVNHVDKDGHTALSISAKMGQIDIVLSLLEKGAYVNIPNKKGDSILITAVKGGQKEIVEALLSKHVEVDAVGSQGKTAMHHAIERGNLDIIRLILSYKPDLEIVANDGDTLLLLAVKKKNAAIVNELLNSGSRVSPTDKNGDNVLHICIRNKSREITELILSNPKNSKYLYKPNKEGETPYKIDASNPKSILTQIFGARQLNMTEDSILGYDLYSGALAEILSEPNLHTPITVGLYAKWGSGKSFLLAQLKSEMKSFASLTHVVNLKLNIFLILTILFLNLFITLPFFFWKWLYGLVLYLSSLFISTLVIIIGKFFYEKREKEWAERLCDKIQKHLTRLKLFLRILFLNPFNYKSSENIEHKYLRFIFTEYGKISTIGGENALALMISSLNTKMETQIGTVITRLCRVFYNKTHSHSKYRRFCCIPTFIPVIIVIFLILGVAIFVRVKGVNIKEFKPEDEAFLYTILFIILISILGSSFTWSKILWYLIRSPSYRIMNAVNSKDTKRYPDSSKIESYIFKLKREVDLISHTIRTIDAFSHSCTRLVIIIDGLDSCEQAKVLQILEIVHVLFTHESDPFVCILAVDPHVLSKGIEGNLIPAFRNGNVNGHDYLRTIIHLPVYLQVDLSKAKALSKLQNTKLKRNSTQIGSSQDILTKIGAEVNSGKAKKNKKNRKRTSTKPMSAIDLTDQLIKSDYFSDVNPRNLRRLINIIALTGRLLRAYHIDFNWRILASWIYLNEQWPYRCSWIVMYYEENEQDFNEESTINEVYDKIKSQIPTSNEPLLELDRNARKFEQFIQNCEPKLTCTILKKILPCTCNLDPFLIKLIKDSIDAKEDRLITQYNNLSSAASNLINLNQQQDNYFNSSSNNQLSFCHGQNLTRLTLPSPNLSNAPLFVNTNNSELTLRKTQQLELNSNNNNNNNNNNLINLSNDDINYCKIEMSKNLSEMSLADICDAVLNSIDLLSEDFKPLYTSLIKEKNLNGKVLCSCDLDELKNELKMSFGDWQLFKEWIKMKRINQKNVNIINKNSYNSSILTKEHETKPKQNQINQPQTTIVTSPSSNNTHGRKVEFYVTPVLESNLTPTISSTNKPSTPTNTESTLNESTKKPLNSILVNSKQKSKIKEDVLQENALIITPEYQKSENIPLMAHEQELEEDNTNLSHMEHSNLINKFGKKLFKSIDNLLHKSEKTSRNASTSHDENETVLSEIKTKKKKIKKSTISAFEDEENVEQNEDEDEDEDEEEDEEEENENSEEKTSSNEDEDLNPVETVTNKQKKEFNRIDSIKKSFIKVKNQLLTDTNQSSSKAELIPNSISRNNSSNYNIQTSVSPSGSNTNKKPNEDQKTTTYLIFEEDECY